MKYSDLCLFFFAGENMNYCGEKHHIWLYFEFFLNFCKLSGLAFSSQRKVCLEFFF